MDVHTNDLISREKALEALREANVRVVGMRVGKTILARYAEQVREGYVDILKGVPTEDVKLVPTGYWIERGKTEKGSIIRQCSHCGVTKAGRPLSKYCPDCGAELSGKVAKKRLIHITHYGDMTEEEWDDFTDLY